MDECLFLRCIPDHVDEGRVHSAGIRFPNTSVNRCRYSEPEDVIIPEPEMAYARLRTRDVPGALTSPGQVTVAFVVEHDPEEDNFSHCEIRAFKDGQHISDKGKLPPSVKKEFRQRVSEKTEVLHDPRRPTTPVGGRCTPQCERS